MKDIWSLCVCLAIVGQAIAESNFDADSASSWSPNAGWFNWRANSENGARIDEFVCGGLLYGSNVGWINLGNGFPANRVHYRNDSEKDFGVNLDSDGNLRGFAYGANIGWIGFEPTGNPRIDLVTGRLSGFAYSANTGWISLGEFGLSPRIESFAPGADSDNDGIPDAWEQQRAGGLTLLNSESDTDNDGLSDVGEYQADTDPLDADEHLQITRIALAGERQDVQLGWITRATRFYSVQIRSKFEGNTPWTELFPDFLRGTGDEVSILVTNTQESSGSFFRVQAKRPLQSRDLTE